MELSEFLNPRNKGSVEEIEQVETSVTPEVELERETESVELDVQKAVVESLAADKAIQDEQINLLRKENYALQSQISALNLKIEEQSVALAKVGDLLAVNAESSQSNQVSLLDRSVELKDRFPGETRDHVLEVIREAREKAEQDGCIRRAQILESVLVANEPVGNLAKNRENLKKLFAESGNIVSGVVIQELNKLGISHKNGENYLLPSEIMKRVY